MTRIRLRSTPARPSRYHHEIEQRSTRSRQVHSRPEEIMDRHLALQCFCRVVETGGFAAAARDLDYSPSMVTKYIQHLEEWTGSRLLARTTRRMQLTEAGERFYAYCRRVLDDTERTLGAIRTARGELPAGWYWRCRCRSRWPSSRTICTPSRRRTRASSSS